MYVQKMFLDALKNNYAIGAFNFTSLELLKAILSVAEELNSPVIAQVSESGFNYIGVNYLKSIIRTVKQNKNRRVIFHLDHGKNFDIIKKAITSGFDSVMIDASDQPFLENIRLTKQVVDYAHKKGVWVEAELGVLYGVEDDISIESKGMYTNPKEAKEFVLKTGVDSLAIAIGTSHGAYKFKGEQKLRLDVLKSIEKILPNYPLVLHGASSIPEDYVELANRFGADIIGAKGILEDSLKEISRKHNIVKINIDSDLRIAFLAGIREYLSMHPENIDSRKYIQNGINKVQDVIKHKITSILLSNNRLI